MKQFSINNLIRAIAIIIFYVAVFLYTIIFNNPTGWLLFFFLTFLFLCDVVTLLPSLKKIKIQLFENSVYEVNQQSQIKLELFRYRPTLLPIPVLMIFLKDSLSIKTQSLSLYSGQKRALTFEWKPTRRGVFKELPLVLISTDLFQVFSKQSTLTLTGPFVIQPVLRLDLAEQLYQQLLQLNPNFATSFGNQNFLIRNFRSYRDGDSFSLVDWKQSSKRNELIIKEYEQDAETDIHFVLYGVADEQFEALLSLYYSFVHLAENKFVFQQTILADYPSFISKELILASTTPLAEASELPTFSAKKVVVFAPSKTDQLLEQLDHLKRNNDLFLITFDGGKLLLLWQDHVNIIDEGGQILEK